MSVKKKIGYQYDDARNQEIRNRIIALRQEALQTNQKNFAKMLGVSQTTISQWESGTIEPPPMALMALGRLSIQDEEWWYQQAGADYAQARAILASFRLQSQVTDDNHCSVPIYGNAGAGPFLFVDANMVWEVKMPRDWFRGMGAIVGLVVAGDSMNPLVQDGDIVFVDRAERSASRLLNKIVAASDGEGVSIKWLRKSGSGHIFVPNNQHIDNPIIPVDRHHEILGRVVRWIGAPVDAEVR